jgi:hypothetical protein
MSARSVHPLVRHGALVGAVLAALVLLVIFHSVVVGAVQNGAHRRAETLQMAAARRAAPPGHSATRSVSLAGAGD